MDFPGHFEQIFQQLNYQRVHGQLCDCAIVVGSRHFKAHRAVLAACSTHFRALFSVSEGDGSVSVIRLDSDVVTSEAFSVLMDMMYTSTLTLGESNVMDVLLAASHLHLNTVVKACKHYLNTRTLPKSSHNECGSQRPVEQQLNNGANPRLQRSFLLQQLGLSVVSSALNEEPEEDGSVPGRGSVSGSGQLEQRDAFYPQRRLQKRKQTFSLIHADAERPRQRPRGPSQARAIVGDCGGEGGARGEELLSPDSHSKTLDDDSKLDVVVIAVDDREEYRRTAAHEDIQMPSQSDGGRGSRAESLLLPPHKEEYTDGDGGQVKGGAEQEAQRMPVVVKSEPISSPEPADETSDVTSQAEGSDQCQVEAVGEKLELSPEGSEHSFSDPQPSSDILISEIKGPVIEEERSGDTGGGGGVERRERGAGLLSTMSFDRVPVPNTTTGECALDHEPPRFLFGSDPSSPSMHLAASQNLLSAEMQEFSNMRADSLLLQPMLDGMAASSSSEHLALEFQRNVCRNGAYRFPPYRRIAPKATPGGALMQDAASSSSVLVNGASFDGPGQRGGNSSLNPLPQLTRASADVLSKCKKALSEHNVLVVEGARKYACKICCKTFLTLTDCKKHIRVHTGEKPYACLKCGKRFSQSSHLYKHSKTTCLRWQNSTMATGLL